MNTDLLEFGGPTVQGLVHRGCFLDGVKGIAEYISCINPTVFDKNSEKNPCCSDCLLSGPLSAVSVGVHVEL